jgi:hypothetical protein
VLVRELAAAQPSLTERELADLTGYDEPTILRSRAGAEEPTRH